jgi:hypothetical protein
MVVDAGQQLALATISEGQPSDDVELPQMHRCLALPAFVLAFVLLGLWIDQAVAGQHPMHGRA